MRKSLTSIHRWVGLILGLYVALLALSGIGMVFSSDFYAWEFGKDKVHVAPQDVPYAPPHLWLQKAEAKYGKLSNVEGYFGPRATPMRISAPTIIYGPIRADGADTHGVVTVNPYTGEPLAHFIAEDTWSMLPLKLHMSLFLPFPLSTWMLVLLSILITGFAISGLILWWPGRARAKAAMAIPRPKNPISLRRFHAGIGFWSAPLLLLAAVTGLMLTKFDWAEIAFAPLGAATTFDPVTAPKPICAAGSLASAGDALSTARLRYPQHELASLFLPTKEEPVYAIWLRPAVTTVPARGDTEVIVDAKCGQILFSRSDAEMKAGDKVLTYLVELHNGRLLGVFGEALIVLQGIVLTLLPIAGITLWFWRRRKRTAAIRLR